MERAKVKDAEITWKKIGRGSLRFKGRIIKPGEVFKARPSELSISLRRFLMPLGEVVEAVKGKEDIQPTVEVISTDYTKVPRGKSHVWFDVVNPKVITAEFPEGKVMNEKALTKEKANAFITSLMTK